MKHKSTSIVAASFIATAFIVFPSVGHAAEAQPLPPAEEKAPEKLKRVTVPFEITDTGHQIVKLVIGETPLRLIVDGGSGGDMLATKTAERLKLAANKAGEDTKGVGGAGPKLMHLENGDPLECQLGEAKIKIDFGFMDLEGLQIAGGGGGVDGILGSPFLQQHKAVIDFGSKTLSFEVSPPA
ncbi:MAG: hypothetical protein JWO82_210 [Akkermansiaceae bacterium]|nr:hypothetical protein [Akkermansiaceae bacterium]